MKFFPGGRPPSRRGTKAGTGGTSSLGKNTYLAVLYEAYICNDMEHSALVNTSMTYWHSHTYVSSAWDDSK